jgi:hypothetical protein
MVPVTAGLHARSLFGTTPEAWARVAGAAFMRRLIRHRDCPGLPLKPRNPLS